MKQISLILSALCFGIFTSFAQTTAPDFTATDCSSVSHNLFTELNSGKVVVLVWVMPCGNCISDAKAGYDAVQSFATSYPGKVLYWMSDDAGNTTCSSLSGWASTNSIGATGLTLFGNAGPAIDEANYGGSGMPHVVVIGGTDHHIYYNQKNGSNDGTAITNAITQALAATGVSIVTPSNQELKLFPNPSKDKISVSYNLAQTTIVNIDIYDVFGKKIKTIYPSMQLSGPHTIDVNFDSKLANGIYVLKLNTDYSSQAVNFTIAD
jgi:hypothetical protein